MKYSEKTGRYLIELLKALMTGDNDVPRSDTDLTELFVLARSHSVANIVLYGLEKAGDILPEHLARQWSELRDKALVSDITLQNDYADLCQAMETEHIRYIPLKGILLKKLYPQSDYRTMSDIDILIDPENAEKVRAVMERLGYDTVSYDHDVHDVYHKYPLTSIEIHRELFGVEGKEFAPLFADPWDMCEVYSEYRYELTAENFFMYILAHAMKHYGEGGTGIRTFIDIQIYLEHYREYIDLQRVYERFDIVGQRSLCEQLVALSDMWFGSGECSKRLAETERYILSGGTYGTFENQVQNELKSKSKANYILHKLFPDLTTMKQKYPLLKKVPILLPAFWLIRIFTKPFTNRRQNMEKLKTLYKE